MTDTVPQLPEDDEINLLDLLQTLVDNLRLLVLGPLAVGVAALGISFAIKPTFTAEMSFLPPSNSRAWPPACWPAWAPWAALLAQRLA